MRISTMSWMQVEAQVRRDDRCVVPLGSTEQHAHLSLAVDSILAERVAIEAAEPLGIPVFPVLAYGVTPYFLAYPGTVSLKVGTYLALTGHPHPRSRPLGVEPPASPLDMPSFGSVISKLRPPDAPVFPYVTLGVLRHLGNHDSMGQDAGCLGKVYDPFSVPQGARDAGGLRTLLGAAAGERLVRRRQLLGTIDRVPAALEATAATRSHDGFAQRAYEILASSASRQAFEIAREPAAVRDAYGPSALGQDCLLARRLVEAGVPLVTVYSVANRDWDTHANNFKDLKEKLLPDTDRALAALLEDLECRGLLEETLVVWMGDMGRTPKVNKDAGRDHWSFCYSVVMAGADVVDPFKD